MSMRIIRAVDARSYSFALKFEWDMQLNEQVRKLGGRFDGTSREWVVNFGSADKVIQLAKTRGFRLDDTAKDLVAAMKAREEEERRKRREYEEWAAHPPRTLDAIEICRWIGSVPMFVERGFCGMCDSDFRNEWCLPPGDYQLHHLSQGVGTKLFPSEMQILLKALADPNYCARIADALRPSALNRARTWFKRS